MAALPSAASRPAGARPPRRHPAPGWPCRPCRRAIPRRPDPIRRAESRPGEHPEWQRTTRPCAGFTETSPRRQARRFRSERWRISRNKIARSRRSAYRRGATRRVHPTTRHRMRGPKLDRIDRQILELLQSDGRMTNIELARRVGISPPPCLRRVRALEEAGLIRGYHADLAAEALGFGVTVFAQVGLQSQAETDLRAFEALVAGWPEVREAHMLAGETDFLLKIVASDWDSYQRFLSAQSDRGSECRARQIGAGPARFEIGSRRAVRRGSDRCRFGRSATRRGRQGSLEQDRIGWAHPTRESGFSAPVPRRRGLGSIDRTRRSKETRPRPPPQPRGRRRPRQRHDARRTQFHSFETLLVDAEKRAAAGRRLRHSAGS